MSVIQAAFLGLVQGLAEFLPISSSGHLNLLQALFGVNVEHQLLFNILLHVGTLGGCCRGVLEGLGRDDSPSH